MIVTANIGEAKVGDTIACYFSRKNDIPVKKTPSFTRGSFIGFC
jgi:hypothetical protein